MRTEYEITTLDDMVYIEECKYIGTDLIDVNNFTFEKVVLERCIGVDVLLGATNLEDDTNFKELLDEYREDWPK